MNKARKFPLFEWYLPKGTTNASNQRLEGASSSCERWGMGFAGVVVIAVIAELTIALAEPTYLVFLRLSVIADAAIAVGIVGEVAVGTIWNNHIQTELRNRSNATLTDAVNAAAEANERAARADLARMKLERQLAPRELTQEQFNIIGELKGQFEIVNIAYETDAETWWFANSIKSAFFAANIKVGMYRRAPDVHSFGTLIYEPGLLRAPMNEKESPLPLGEVVLMKVFQKAAVFKGALALISHPPTDVSVPLDAPLIIVGGRFLLPPSRLNAYVWQPKAAEIAKK